VRDLEPLEILGRRLQKRVLALPLVVRHRSRSGPQLKPQCGLHSRSAKPLWRRRCLRGQFMEDRQGRMSVEDTRRAQAESDRAARFGAEDVMYGRYGDQRAARFGAQEAMRTGFETDEASRIAQMNAYQNMAPLISDLQNQAAAGLISVGEAQSQLDQRALDLAYADYLDQKEYPYEQLNFAMGALSGTPYNKINRGYNMATTMAANPSVYGQTIAGLGSLASAYGAYKNSNR
jgi:hypothetical protein